MGIESVSFLSRCHEIVRHAPTLSHNCASHSCFVPTSGPLLRRGRRCGDRKRVVSLRRRDHPDSGQGRADAEPADAVPPTPGGVRLSKRRAGEW